MLEAARRLAKSLKFSKGQPATAPVEVTLAESQLLGAALATLITAQLIRRVPEGTPLRDRLVAQGQRHADEFTRRLDLIQSTSGVNSLAYKFMAAEAALKSE
jgi:hypothetical protein